MATMQTLDPQTRYDVAIVGGGPAGLAAALTLGRARRRVLLLDAGAPRNARAHEVHGFVTRDGIAPAEFRRVAHEQLAPYASVDRAGLRITAISGEPDDFVLQAEDGTTARARRVLLALGMVDELPDMPGYEALWGEAIFQCPFCHGWEVQDRAFGFLAPGLDKLEFSLFLKNWSADVVAFTGGAFDVPDAVRDRLADHGVRLEERPIRGLVAAAGAPRLEAVELEDGTRIARDVLFARPPQRQVALVEALGLNLDPNGFVQVDARLATSRPGLYAAGDITTMMQTATAAAAQGVLAGAMLAHDLTYTPVGAPA